ncbi:MAG: TRAP transporter small permease subunit [Burkholderiaceae bacterium]
MGCAYHVKHRTHLRFDGVRAKMPRLVQALLYWFDDLLWLLMASIVLTASLHLVQTQLELGGMIEGTNVIPMAFATAAVPVGWSLIVIRSLQDMAKVWKAYRDGDPFKVDINDGSVGG